MALTSAASARSANAIHTVDDVLARFYHASCSLVYVLCGRGERAMAPWA